MISNNSIVLLTSPHLLTVRASMLMLWKVFLLLVTLIICILMNTMVMVLSQELLASSLLENFSIR